VAETIGEEVKQEELTIKLAKPGFKITEPEAIMSSGTPEPMEDPQPQFDKTSETIVSGMGDKKNYPEVTFQANINEMERRRRAIAASVFSSKSTIYGAVETLKAISKAPLSKRTLGESTTDVITKSLSKADRKLLAHGLDVADGQQATRQGITKNLNFPKGNFEAGMNAPHSAVKSMANHFGAEGVETPNDFLGFLDTKTVEYYNPIGGESKEGMDIPLWEMTKDIFTGDFDSDDFDKRMTSNYGDEWGQRFAGFIGKEIAIDAVILGATFFIPPLAGMVALGMAARRAGFLGAMIRSAAIGVGGGAAQAVQNVHLGRDANFATEALFRAGGQGAAEGIGHLVGAGVKAFRGKSFSDNIATNAIDEGTKPLTKAQLKEALSPTASVSTHSSLTRAQLNGIVSKYKASVNDIADELVNKELDPVIKSGLASHLGVDESRLGQIRTDMVLPLFKNENEALIQNSLRIPFIERQGVEFTGLKDLLGTYFGDGKELVVGLRASSDNINKSTIPSFNKAAKWLGIAEPEKEGLQTGANVHTMKNFTAKQQEGFGKMYDEVEKGMSKKDLNLLGAIAKEGDANEVIYNFTSQSPKLMTNTVIPPKVQAAYHKYRFVNDLSYEVADAGAVATLKDSVFKYRGKFVQVQKSAKGLKDFGKGEKIVVREFDPHSMLAIGPLIKNKVLASTLRDPKAVIDTIVPYRTGHVPRVYRDQRFAVVVLDRKVGRVSYEATFDSAVEADKWHRQRMAVIREKGGEDASEIAVKIWNKTDTGAGGAHMTRHSAKLLSQVDDVTADMFRKGLRENGINEKQVNVILKDMLAAPVVPGHSKARTIGLATTKVSHEARLELAAKPGRKDAQAAFAKIIADETPFSKAANLNYYSSVAHNSGYDNWRKFGMDDWSARYGHLSNGEAIDPLLVTKSSFGEPPTYGANKWRTDTKEALDYARWIKNTIKDRDWLENRYDEVFTNFSDNMARLANEGSISAKSVSWAMDHMPLAKELENNLRFVGAFPKLLTLNMAQIVVQGSQAVLSAGAAFGFNPALAMKSMWKLANISGLETARRLKIRAPKASAGPNSIRTMHKEMIESGYFADLSSTDIAFGIKHGLDPGRIRRSWEYTKNIAASPFRFGEAINRAMAYVTVRDQIAFAIGQANKKGFANLSDNMKMLASDFDGIPMVLDDIGSHAFREAVIDKAKILALNMGKAGELRAMSGSLSVGLQFKQVLAKELSVMDSSKLTLREKIVGGGSMIGLFGAGAIPLAGDMLRLADYGWSSDDDPQNRLFFTGQAKAFNAMLGDNLESFSNGFVSTEGVQRFFAKGAITAASEGEIDFANRVALGSFLSETWDVQDPWEMVVSVAVLQDMIQASNALGITTMLNPLSYIEVSARVMAGEDFKDILIDKFEPDTTAAKLLSGDIELGGAILDIMREGGKVFSQAGSISRLLDASHRDIVTPEAYWRNPLADQMYTTSGLRGLPVARTRMRDIQFLIGITPGKIVEEYSKQKTERIYAEALKDFNKDLEKRFRRAFQSRDLQNRIAKDAVQKIVLFRKHMQDLGLDTPVPTNALKSIYSKINKLILDVQTGGRQ